MKVISVAQAAKIADTGSRELQSSTAGASSGFPKEEKSLHKFTTTATVKPKDNPGKSKDCYRCCAKCNPDQCRFKSEKCHYTRPHSQSLSKQEETKSESRLRPTNQVIELTSSTTDYTLFPVSTPEGKPLQTTVDVEDHPFVIEIDTGAAVSLINETTYKSSPFLSKLPLRSSMVQLHTYTGETISVTGDTLVKVQSGRQSHTLPS